MFHKLFQELHDYLKEIGITGVVGGTLALYFTGSVTDVTKLAVVAGAGIAPYMLMPKKGSFSVTMLDILTSLGPFAVLYFYGFNQLSLETAAIYAIGGSVTAYASTMVM